MTEALTVFSDRATVKVRFYKNKKAKNINNLHTTGRLARTVSR
jgi:hypothetical protein